LGMFFCVGFKFATSCVSFLISLTGLFTQLSPA
jgi:hypothetical protein